MTDKTLPELLPEIIADMRTGRAECFAAKDSTDYIFAFSNGLCVGTVATGFIVIRADRATAVSKDDNRQFLNRLHDRAKVTPRSAVIAEEIERLNESIAIFERRLCECQSLGG